MPADWPVTGAQVIMHLEKGDGSADIVPEPAHPKSLSSMIWKEAQPKPSILTTMAER
jgi:hypothetical protein